MGTTDDNGIYFYEDTDGAPVASLLNIGQQSVSDALNNLGTYRSAASDAEQAIVVADYAPSPTKPLLVYRQDYQAARAWRWTTDGSTWRTLSTTQARGSIGNAANFNASNTTVYAEGEFASISGYIQSTTTGGMNQTPKPIGVIHISLAPTVDTEIFPIYSTLPVPVMGRVTSGGGVQASIAEGFPTQPLTSSTRFYLSSMRWKCV